MAVGDYVAESWTTGGVAPQERADFWSEQVTSYHAPMDFRFSRPDSFRGAATRQSTDTYQLVTFSSDEITYIRTPKQVRREPDEDYRLVVPLAGKVLLRQDDQELLVVPGTGALVSFAEPFEALHNASIQAFALTIPADEVNGPLSRSSPLAAGLDMTSGLGRVVADMLTDLSEALGSSTAGEFDAASDQLVKLICMLVEGDDRPDAPEHLAKVEAMVRRYVREHVTDPELTGEAVARAMGWPLRRLELALLRVGTTPRELIRGERLRLVRERLEDPVYRHMTILDLAYATGFSSATALHTAFRQHFGISPRDISRTGTVAD